MRTTHGAIYLRSRTLAPAARLFIETLRAVEQELQPAEQDASTLPTPIRKRRRNAA